MLSTKPVAIVVIGIVFISLLALAYALPTPQLAPRIRVGPSTSANWSGYAVTGSKDSVSDVKASWVVPAIQGTCPSTNQYAAFWVGIDGYSSNTVEQTGTSSDCQNGSPAYYAWYEFYPKASVTIASIPIAPNDKISAEVNYTGGAFTITISDLTTSKTFSSSATIHEAKRSSAEWIAEAPSSGRVLPLADFGTVTFGYDNTNVKSTCYATVSGVTGPIGSFGSSVQTITMVTRSSSTKAQPSTLSSDGTSFSITWKSAGP